MTIINPEAQRRQNKWNLEFLVRRGNSWSLKWYVRHVHFSLFDRTDIVVTFLHDEFLFFLHHSICEIVGRDVRSDISQ